MSTAAFWARYLWHPLGFAGLKADEFKKRTTAVQLTLFTMLAAIPYSLVYAWLGFPPAPWATFVYLGFSLANLLLLLTKRYELFTTAQLVAIILNPIMAHVAIGGFVNSSAIILSAILSPLGALMFTNARTARFYFGLFIADVVLAGLWDYRYVSGEPRLPKGVLIVSFVSNLVIICLVIYLLIQNVLEKRDEAERELQASLAHLQATQAQMVQREKMAGLGELTAGIAHEIQNSLNFVTNFAEVSTELCQEAQEILAAPALPPPPRPNWPRCCATWPATRPALCNTGSGRPPSCAGCWNTRARAPASALPPTSTPWPRNTCAWLTTACALKTRLSAPTKVFQHFFTTKPAGEGTGLGLSLAHEIVTQGHGGTLTVESHEGQGTDFIITLPC